MKNSLPIYFLVGLTIMAIVVIFAPPPEPAGVLPQDREEALYRISQGVDLLISEQSDVREQLGDIEKQIRELKNLEEGLRPR